MSETGHGKSTAVFSLPNEMNSDIVKATAKKIADVFYNKQTTIRERRKIIVKYLKTYLQH